MFSTHVLKIRNELLNFYLCQKNALLEKLPQPLMFNFSSTSPDILRRGSKRKQLREVSAGVLDIMVARPRRFSV